MKNKDVAYAFINGREAGGSNFRTDGLKLYSYTSLMAKWEDGNIIVYNNIANYSQTSKKHWFYLRTQAPSNKLVIKE